MPSSLRLPAAGIALLAVLGGGAIWFGGLSSHPSPPAVTTSPVPSLASDPADVPSTAGALRPSPSTNETVAGWPSSNGSWPGLFSWDGGLCARGFCNVGFMHNCYGPCDTTITVGRAPDGPIAAGASAVTIAGHRGWYRRVVEPEPSSTFGDLPLYEDWVVEIDSIAIAIRLFVEPGARETSLGDAHAIIRSLRAEPSTRGWSGFRLVFRLTNSDWDSG